MGAGECRRAFAIITPLYNLPQRQGKRIDLEGMVMPTPCAPRHGRGFENYLKRNLGPCLGSRANIAPPTPGRAAIFETHNHGISADARSTAATTC